MSSSTISIALIGGGSNYTPELIEGIISYDPQRLPVGRITMQDIHPERLNAMVNLAKRMVAESGRDIAIEQYTELDDALTGTDFVICQIRVGGLQGRYLDETIPLKYGIVGQETTGPGGMCKALRTIPEMLNIARAVERVAPHAWMLNYTNPSGIITEAIIRHTKAKVIGLCSGIPLNSMELINAYGKDYPDMEISSIGLNHLGFIHRITSEGKDVTTKIIERLVDDKDLFKDRDAMRPLIKSLNAFPISYLDYFFHKNASYEKARDVDMPRSRQVMHNQRELFSEVADPNVCEKPHSLKKRGGGGYSNVTFTTLESIYNDSGEKLICSVQNNGAVKDIDDNAVVEVLCSIGKNGATPVYQQDEIPLAYRGLVQSVKAYETLTVEAAVQKSKNLCYHALLNNPLCGDFDIIKPLVDEMLDANGLLFS